MFRTKASFPAVLSASCLIASAVAGQGFVPGWGLAAGSSNRSVALGDVDGDGDVDAYVTEIYGPDVLWLNDGEGSFTRGAQALDAGYANCARFAPLDAGTSVDLWLTRHLQGNGVWLNDGAGSFTDSGQTIGAGLSRSGCSLGDVDGDGDLDAFVPTNTPMSSNELFLNDGAGAFSSSGQALGNYSSRAVALGDVDGDSDLDALVGNNGANKLWLNDGAGIFTDSGIGAIGTSGTFDVALGDLDGDSDLDAFFANGGGSGAANEVWLGDGSGGFVSSGQSLGSDYSFAVALLDCDGDGDLDAFVGNNDGQPNRLYTNDGTGGFTDSGQAVGVGGAHSVAASDLDGNGTLDLFLANGEQPEQVFLGAGGCQFIPSGQLLGSSAAVAIELGDVDGDGDADAMLGTYGGITRLLRNDGAGLLTDDDQWLTAGFGPDVARVELADFDGDGDLDAWTGLCCSGGAASDDPGDRLWWNDGAGLFTDSGQSLGSEYTTGSAVSDLDGDGDLDVVVAVFPSLFSPGTNHVYWNDGAGQLTQGPQALGSGNHTAVAIAPLDAGTSPDLFFVVRGAGSRVWLNDGSGTFADTGQALGSANAYAVALGDLDRDGDTDAFLGNDGANTVWLNDGMGGFVDSGQALGTRTTSDVHLLDADGDGDLDAWTTSSGGFTPQPNEVWLNDGTGHFTTSGWPAGSGSDARSALADLDGDYDPDLVLVSFFGDHQVWLNQLDPLIFADGFESGDTGAW